MTDDPPRSSSSTHHPVWLQETARVLAALKSDTGNSGHIAIISEYMAGRERVANAALEEYQDQAVRISLTSCTDSLDVLMATEHKIIIVENCQFLAERRIGGFARLHAFIDTLIVGERTVVTTWNMHSWRYLDACFGISRHFPHRIILGKITLPQLREFIFSYHEGSRFYLLDVPVPRRMVLRKTSRTFRVPYVNQPVPIPYYYLKFRLLYAIIRGMSDYEEPDEVIFERLLQVSNGNPGVALKFWEHAIDAWEIRLSRITPFPIPPFINPDQAYLLSIILMYEEMQISDLLAFAPRDIPIMRLLSPFIRDGIIIRSGDRISLEPLALAGITSGLIRLRMVW